MNGGRRLLTGFVATGLAACLAGCGGGGGGATTTGTPSASPLHGHLTVFAAASLTEAFTDAERTLEARHPGFSATFSFAGSQQLVANIADGAPADVIATANQATMQTLVSAGLVSTPRTFARNRLEIAVAKGNPRHIAGLAGLAKPGLSVVLADPSVPAGAFAVEALARAGVHVTPKSLELDVKAALEKVSSGDADAAIVYTTDVTAAAGSVDGVPIPDAENVIASYPIAVVRASANAVAAAAFVADAVSGDVQAALRARGFLPPG